ncbi:MAG: VCBS repeat-containing protein, partial [Melioribacteraceae bacterium]
MKFYHILFVVVLFPIIIFSQNNWDVVWTMDQKPFLDPKTDSEMAIVKAGFDTDQDGWGEFLCAWTDKEHNYILMYEASADNTYDLVWYWKYPVQSNTFAGIAVGDFDNNGKPEIITTVPTVVGTDSPKRLWVFEWSGVIGENKYGRGELGEVTATNSWNFGLPDGIDFRPYSLTLEDIDKDGKNELIVGVRMGGRGREIFVVSTTGNLSGFGTFNVEFNFKD